LKVLDFLSLPTAGLILPDPSATSVDHEERFPSLFRAPSPNAFDVFKPALVPFAAGVTAHFDFLNELFQRDVRL